MDRRFSGVLLEETATTYRRLRDIGKVARQLDIAVQTARNRMKEAHNRGIVTTSEYPGATKSRGRTK